MRIQKPARPTVNGPLLERLLSGDEVFLPGVDHADVNGQASLLYRAVRARGLYLHMHQGFADGAPGLRVWADKVSTRKATREPRLSSIAQVIR